MTPVSRFRCQAASIMTLAVAAFLSGCFKSAPPPPAPVTPPPGQVNVPRPPAGPSGTPIAPPTGKVVEGGKFNKLFPADEAGYNVIYTQEKQGFAQAFLNKNKKKVAVLSVSDIVANPEAINKYASATKKVAGYPAVAVGNNGTAILVGNRYQVQVRTEPNAAFTPQDRETWLAKFKLADLARMGGN
jgi:hypothetical protein